MIEEVKNTLVSEKQETARASYTVGSKLIFTQPLSAAKVVSISVSTGFKALTLFVRENKLQVHDGAGGTEGRKLAELTLRNEGKLITDDKKLLGYEPNYPSESSTYYFNLGDLLGAKRENPCTLYESETDYPRAKPLRMVGADGIGNHRGQQVFKKQTYTFWITFDEEKHILPHSGSYDWEAQIVCGFK